MSDDGATLNIWLKHLDSLLGRGANSGRQGEAEGGSRRQGGEEAGAPGGEGVEGWAWSSSFGNGEEETHGRLERRRNWEEDAAKVGLG